MDVLKFSDSRIYSLDYILETFKSEGKEIIDLVENDNDKYNYLRVSAKILSDFGLIRLHNSPANHISMGLTHEGVVFIETNTFAKIRNVQQEKIKNEEEKLKYARTQNKVNEKALRAYKREPWLIAWSIISTIAAILIGILK